MVWEPVGMCLGMNSQGTCSYFILSLGICGLGKALNLLVLKKPVVTGY